MFNLPKSPHTSHTRTHKHLNTKETSFAKVACSTDNRFPKVGAGRKSGRGNAGGPQHDSTTKSPAAAIPALSVMLDTFDRFLLLLHNLAFGKV